MIIVKAIQRCGMEHIMHLRCTGDKPFVCYIRHYYSALDFSVMGMCTIFGRRDSLGTRYPGQTRVCYLQAIRLQQRAFTVIEVSSTTSHTSPQSLCSVSFNNIIVSSKASTLHKSNDIDYWIEQKVDSIDNEISAWWYRNAIRNQQIISFSRCLSLCNFSEQPLIICS